MKVPEKVVPLLFVLLLVAAFLLGRYQAQLEFLRAGSLSQPASQAGTQPAGGALGQTTQQGQAAPGGKISDELWAKVLSNPAASRGSEDAPVTIVEFSDYQCPYCARYITDAYLQIEKDYVETGKVRYLFRDLTLPFHANASAAAQAARCAGEQGQYWEMHDVLFEKQSDWASGDAAELFKGYAGELVADIDVFLSCYENKKYEQEINEDLQLARQVGADGAPAFFINGKLIIGALPFQPSRRRLKQSSKRLW